MTSTLEQNFIGWAKKWDCMSFTTDVDVVYVIDKFIVISNMVRLH